jgi:pimeloyl-ACP methyl ester carboxylesterase
MNKVKLSFLTLCILAISVRCSDDKEDSAPQTLVEATALFTRDAAELRTYLEASSFDLPVEELQYDVEVFRVTYKTTYKGETVNASGLVILPATSEAVGMVSFHHGTISAHADAPTELALSDTELILYSALASPGFIAVIPDYLGFGESSEIRHPYYDEALTASAIIDNIKAAKELAAQEGINFNDKLFLAGYSQGGYATMATHKAIEEDGLSGFTLVTSYPAAGGYDVKGMQETFFTLDTYGDPSYLGYVASAYRSTYDWEQPLSIFFQEPYATTIPDLFDGSKTMSQVNDALTDDVQALLQPDAIANFETSSTFAEFRQALIENSLTDWTPTIPMYMYHGTADVTVFYQNSVDTRQALLDNGASASIVTLTDLPDATHATGIGPYLELVIPDLLSKR